MPPTSPGRVSAATVWAAIEATHRKVRRTGIASGFGGQLRVSGLGTTGTASVMAVIRWFRGTVDIDDRVAPYIPQAPDEIDLWHLRRRQPARWVQRAA